MKKKKQCDIRCIQYATLCSRRRNINVYSILHKEIIYTNNYTKKLIKILLSLKVVGTDKWDVLGI